MKHKHYEMIVAKAANMELVVFVKTCDNGAWYEKGDNSACQWWEDSDYFLCLPKHKEAVLNLLNGGESQITFNGECWDKCNLNEPVEWNDNWWYMKGESQSRIKPKKEKRWIGCYPSAKVTPLNFSSIDEVKNYVSKNSLYTHCAHEAWQFIEIEVEV